MSEFRIARKGRDCSVCGRAFPAGEDFVSAIFEVPEGEDGLFERIDACPGCFERVGREPYSRWQTRLPPDREKGPLLDLGMARDFLVRLAREGDPERGPLMHLLALLLLRKRQVKLLARRNEEEGPFLDLLVKTQDGEEELAVPSAPPTDEEAAELQAELGRLFGFADESEPDD